MVELNGVLWMREVRGLILCRLAVLIRDIQYINSTINNPHTIPGVTFGNSSLCHTHRLIR